MPASRSASSAVSAVAMPSRTSSPCPIAPTISPSTVTLALRDPLDDDAHRHSLPARHPGRRAAASAHARRSPPGRRRSRDLTRVRRAGSTLSHDPRRARRSRHDRRLLPPQSRGSRLRARRPRRLRLAAHALVRVGARRSARAGRAALQRAVRAGADRDRRGARRVDGDAARGAAADAARRPLRPRVAAAPRRLSRALRGRGRRAAPQARARPHRPARAERGSRRSPRRERSPRARRALPARVSGDVVHAADARRPAATSGSGTTAALPASRACTSTRRPGAWRRSATSPRCRSFAARAGASSVRGPLPAAARGRDRDDRPQREGGQRRRDRRVLAARVRGRYVVLGGEPGRDPCLRG